MQKCQECSRLAMGDTRRQSALGHISAELHRAPRPLRPTQKADGVRERDPMFHEKTAQTWQEDLYTCADRCSV
jgi:hypothetical protein